MKEHLGRGLSALIPDKEEREDLKAHLSTLPIERIKRNPLQPRLVIDDESLMELAESIKANGIIQPIIVNKTAGSDYELIAGERRLQAAKLAGLDSVPVVIRSVDKKEQLQLAIVENIQRKDLDPIEEARAYQTLVEDFSLTHQEIAQIVGKDRPTISNCIRLLKLPVEIQALVSEGKLSSGHARAILSIDPEYQLLFAQHIIKYHLTVRQAEEKAKTFVPQQEKPKSQETNPEILKSLEKDLHKILGLKVKVKERGGKGKITLEYSSPEELKHLKELLNTLRRD
ncbi:MAG TPA: ParB/RepB/Spo0J family partition protein [Candidatus Syntrophosphaera sp.]|jgi:ParB family chromosome partitioning protein|uniref:ParB/RepB/Spo0J family partition protein n=1 Tax=Candidatus Syntrophosphaera thermopropionivorans TaxID=2593015 RepID=A0AC61QKS4_9BACT|nr:ParB/RepB/Spo0J family partition protein [Candidatus Syntrophosphaera thermopropionivorans]TDF74563.1 ParB/RepB/Spo0J family partition protein [Candidatus Syntrophosphaera thermopropionivorans]HRR98074.1 ParB/RepB/Spo0J family partition protein [Candidatus Syntrophosphaera sp.]